MKIEMITDQIPNYKRLVQIPESQVDRKQDSQSSKLLKRLSSQDAGKRRQDRWR